MTENKAKIAITIDPHLLQRLDYVAEQRGQSRSAIIERIIRHEIDSEEVFVKDMESPVMRTIMGTMMHTPGVMEGIAKLIGQNLTAEDMAQMKSGLKEQKQRGKERQAQKKAKPTTA